MVPLFQGVEAFLLCSGHMLTPKSYSYMKRSAMTTMSLSNALACASHTPNDYCCLYVDPSGFGYESY